MHYSDDDAGGLTSINWPTAENQIMSKPTDPIFISICKNGKSLPRLLHSIFVCVSPSVGPKLVTIDTSNKMLVLASAREQELFLDQLGRKC